MRFHGVLTNYVPIVKKLVFRGNHNEVMKTIDSNMNKNLFKLCIVYQILSRYTLDTWHRANA